MSRLLLVDDDPSLAAIVRVLARRAGHDLVCAADSAQATPHLADADLLLLDVNLPGVSGTDWLATLTHRPPTALFIQSGLEDDVVRGWDAGAEYHLAKELVTDAAAFLARLAEILAHADGRRGGASVTCPASAATPAPSWIRPPFWPRSRDEPTT